MIDKQILSAFFGETEEERDILRENNGINKALYSHTGGNIVNAEKLLDKGKLITIRPHTRFVHFPEHYHDFVEVVYMCSGKTTHIVNGEKILLSEGELLFLGQNARQEILPAGKEDIAVNFIILPQFFSKSIEMLGEEESPLRKFLIGTLLQKNCPTYLHFKVADVLPVQNLIENLLWTLQNNIQNKRNIHQTTMGLLIMQLLNYTDRLVYHTKGEEVIMQVFRYIEENYRQGSLTEAALLLHCDFAWLSREIKEQTGKNYTELLQDKRLAQAAYLLKNTKSSIEEISVSVGYSNKSYFYRIFEEKYGISPKKYRNA